MNIEPLESRIVPAAIAMFTDVDGDMVKVTASKGTSTDLQTATHVTAGQLTLLDLTSASWDDEFKGTNITITVTEVGAAGDGTVNVGFINGTGIDLGAVSVAGDLGKIVAGTGGKTAAIKSLSAHSLGKQGLNTGAPNLESDINGALGALKVSGDVQDAFVAVSKGAIGSIAIGGSLIGGTAHTGGNITALDSGIGKVTIGGDILGGVDTTSGAIAAKGNIAGVTVSGSLIGGGGFTSGVIFSPPARWVR